jgi:hypothetical protein
MALPGLRKINVAGSVLALTDGTYSDLVLSTLGSMGTSGDDLDLSSQALAELMSAFETDVSSTDATDTIPDVTHEVLSTAVLEALAIEAATATATELALSDALDFLAAGIGVWSVLDDLVSLVNTEIRNLITYVNQAVFTAVSNPFGLGPGIDGF